MLKKMLLGAALLYGGVSQAQDYSVVNMSPRVYNNANFLYQTVSAEEPKYEYILHLGGEVRDDTLHITNAALPAVRTFSKQFITTEQPFLENYVGTIHSHPNSEACIPSMNDIKTFFDDERGLVMGIACDKGLKIYNKHSLRAIEGLEDIINDGN